MTDARPDVRFLLYGAAPPGNERYHALCMELYDELGLANNVSFEGFSSNILEAYARANLVVLSSISEGFPFSTLEAMLCGRAVVATAVGGVAEQITADCGRVVRPRDPDALGGRSWTCSATWTSARHSRRRRGNVLRASSESSGSGRRTARSTTSCSEADRLTPRQELRRTRGS